MTVERNAEGDAWDQDLVDDLTIELVPSLSASPSAASPGETVLLQLRDFPAGGVRKITLADETVTEIGGTIPLSGDYNQKIVIPNNVPEGKQSLKLNYRPSGAAKDESERVTLDIGGPILAGHSLRRGAQPAYQPGWNRLQPRGPDSSQSG